MARTSRLASSASCLGARFDPFVLNADPNASDFQIPDLQPVAGVTKARWTARLAALKSFDRAAHIGQVGKFC